MRRWLQDPHVRLHIKQVSRFAVSGVLGATMEFTILGILVGHYKITPFISYIFSAGIPAFFVFMFNKHITFGSFGDKTSNQTIRFVMVYATAFVLNYLLSSLFYVSGARYIQGTILFGITLEHDYIAYGAKALAIGVTAVWNYFFSHFFIFKKVHVPAEAEAAGLI